jgi:hypothetical protein
MVSRINPAAAALCGAGGPDSAQLVDIVDPDREFQEVQRH